MEMKKQYQIKEKGKWVDVKDGSELWNGTLRYVLPDSVKSAQRAGITGIWRIKQSTCQKSAK
jgi:hypothetical protein